MTFIPHGKARFNYTPEEIFGEFENISDLLILE